MKYEAGIGAIVITIKKAFKRCTKSRFGHIFARNCTQPKALTHGIQDSGSKFNVQQNGHHLKT